MTRITLTEAREKLGVWPFKLANDDELTVALEALGIEVEDDKPAPGTWHITENGSPARINWDGWLHVFYSGGEFDIRGADDEWPDLRPARVVPAAPAPVELLTWEQVRRAIADTNWTPDQAAHAVMGLIERTHNA